MRIAVASDHAGFSAKHDILAVLKELGHDAIDLGAYDESPSDYPDFADKLGAAVNDGRAERGVLVCGSGVGACVAANKIHGIRACVCHDTYSAHQGVEHDDMNVLVLGGRVIGPAMLKELVTAFVHAVFSKEARHVRRLNKVLAIDAREMTGSSVKGQG